jgi:hypothetical protein
MKETLSTSTSLGARIHAVYELAGTVAEGGCYMRVCLGGRARASSRPQYTVNYHCGQWHRDAFESFEIVRTLCLALITDSEYEVREAAATALGTLCPIGDETAKHALCATLTAPGNSAKGRQKMLFEASASLLRISAIQDDELVGRLALMCMSGCIQKEEWLSSRYDELSAQLPLPGNTLPRHIAEECAKENVKYATGMVVGSLGDIVLGERQESKTNVMNTKQAPLVPLFREPMMALCPHGVPTHASQPCTCGANLSRTLILPHDLDKHSHMSHADHHHHHHHPGKSKTDSSPKKKSGGQIPTSQTRASTAADSQHTHPHGMPLEGCMLVLSARSKPKSTRATTTTAQRIINHASPSSTPHAHARRSDAMHILSEARRIIREDVRYVLNINVHAHNLAILGSNTPRRGYILSVQYNTGGGGKLNTKLVDVYESEAIRAASSPDFGTLSVQINAIVDDILAGKANKGRAKGRAHTQRAEHGSSSADMHANRRAAERDKNGSAVSGEDAIKRAYVDQEELLSRTIMFEIDSIFDTPTGPKRKHLLVASTTLGELLDVGDGTRDISKSKVAGRKGGDAGVEGGELEEAAEELRDNAVLVSKVQLLYERVVQVCVCVCVCVYIYIYIYIYIYTRS